MSTLPDETVTSGFADSPAWGSGWKCVSELGSIGLVNLACKTCLLQAHGYYVEP